MKRLRGDRTQADVAEAAEMPLRTYQRYEAGQLPTKKPEHLTALADVYSVSVGRLVQDPDLVPEAPKTTPEQALAILAEAIKRPATPDLTVPGRRIVSALSPLNEEEDGPFIDTLLNMIGEYTSMKKPRLDSRQSAHKPPKKNRNPSG